MIIRPGGYSSDEEDDFYGFGDFDLSTSKPISRPKTGSYGLGETREIYNEKVSDMERLKDCILMGEVQQLTEILAEASNLNINAEFESMQWTPLLYAASLGTPEILYELLIFGADPNIHKDSYTPLMATCACENRSEENLLKCVQYLTVFGANVKTADRHGMTPLMYAAQHGHEDIVIFLLPHSDIDAEDTQGWNALFFAVERGDIKIVEQLLTLTVNITKQDVRGNTVKQLAIDRGFLDICDLVTDPNEVKIVSLEEIESSSKIPVWEDMFPGITKTKCPAYIDDVKTFLFGVSLARYIPIFESHKVGFPQLLTSTDGQLESIGLFLPFERRRLLHAIHSFHQHRWSRKSITQVPKDSLSVFDVLCTLGSANKHFTIMNSSLKYVNSRLVEQVKETKFMDSVNKFSDEKAVIFKDIEKLKARIRCMKSTLKKLDNCVKKVESNVTVPADLITSSNFKVTRFGFTKNILYYSLATLSILYVVKHKCFVNQISTQIPNLLNNYLPKIL